MNLKDVWNFRITQVGVGLVDNAINQSLAEHNRQMDAMMSLFVETTTDFKTTFVAPQVGRLQGLDENGKARTVKLVGRYDVSLPLKMAGTAWGANYITKVKMTVEEAARFTNVLTDFDARWMKDNLLAAIFQNGTYSVNDPRAGTLTIAGLANGDSTPYQVPLGGDTATTNHNHYLAQAAGIADASNPFPTIWQHLIEHPENGSMDTEIICFVPDSQLTAVQNLANFRPVFPPQLRPAATEQVLTATLSDSVPGRVVGFTNRCWIVHWPSLPADYVVAVATQGPKAIAMRQEPEPELQGFNRVADDGDLPDADEYPFWHCQYQRIAGFAGWNRVGALVYRIGNASYAVPSGLTQPLP